MLENTQMRWAYFDAEGDELPQTAISGYAMFVIEGIKGKTAVIDTEQKLLAHGIRAICLGSNFEDDEDFNLTIEGHPFRGFTTDPEIVQLTLEFWAAVHEEKFAPQILLKSASDFED